MSRAERTQTSLESKGFSNARAELPRAGSWPPPPHDPRERELVTSLRGWEIRVFGEHRFQYFVRHGFWHLQLWQPAARVSVLTPSRLTCELYEVFPVAGWKGHASKYQELAELVQGEHGLELPREMELLELERALVQRVKTRFQRLS
jgi:hypothetical protein